MNSILVLLRKDFTNFFRNKAAVSITFLVPFVMIYLFGQIFGVNRKNSGPNGIPLAVVNASDNPAAAKFVDALKAEKSFRVLTQFVNPDKSTRPLTEADARTLIRRMTYDVHGLPPSIAEVEAFAAEYVPLDAFDWRSKAL